LRYRGKQVKRRIGPAWLACDFDGGQWQPRRGRLPDGVYESTAHVKAAGMVAEYVREATEVERVEQERRTAGVTFREVAHAYMAWLEDMRGAKPSTLRDHRSVFAEPGTDHRRGGGSLLGHPMAALGDQPAAKIGSRDVEGLLNTVAKTGASPSTVNKYRARVSAVFSYGMRESTFGLAMPMFTVKWTRSRPRIGCTAPASTCWSLQQSMPQRHQLRAWPALCSATRRQSRATHEGRWLQARRA
jgi:hypothetical protein